MYKRVATFLRFVVIFPSSRSGSRSSRLLSEVGGVGMMVMSRFAFAFGFRGHSPAGAGSLLDHTATAGLVESGLNYH